uniref:Uncharacterized protein n=1 Tax=Romanomermis culicivorax TaxID=13658 RepID=A0A915KSF9_ROMCU
MRTRQREIFINIASFGFVFSRKKSTDCSTDPHDFFYAKNRIQQYVTEHIIRSKISFELNFESGTARRRKN